MHRPGPTRLQSIHPQGRALAGGIASSTFSVLICFTVVAFPSAVPPIEVALPTACPKDTNTNECGLLRLLTANNNSGSDNRTNVCLCENKRTANYRPPTNVGRRRATACLYSVGRFPYIRARTNKYLPYAYHD